MLSPDNVPNIFLLSLRVANIFANIIYAKKGIISFVFGID